MVAESRRALGRFQVLRRLVDARLVLADPDQTKRELAGDPGHGREALVRFVNKMPRWIVAAATRVVNHYDGDAGAIWNDEPTARALMDRLQAFEGIGQKKAAMAVELLARYLNKTILDLPGGEVAFDVHIRRVFARTGLAEHDTQESVIAAARRAHPARPGALDGRAWVIGRNWCRPEVPDCDACVYTVNTLATAEPVPETVRRRSQVLRLDRFLASLSSNTAWN